MRSRLGAATHVVEVNGEELRRYTLTPGDVGIELAAEGGYEGGTPEENAAVTRAILAGERGVRADSGADQRGRRDLCRRRCGEHRGGCASGARGARGRERTERLGALPTGQPALRTRGDRAMSTHTPTVLERILQSTREEVERRKRELPREELEHRALALGEEPGARERVSERRCAGPGMAVIAEFKRRSPSAGTLREAADVHDHGGRVRARRRERAVGADGGPELRRVARGSACRACRMRAADPAQGFHRR